MISVFNVLECVRQDYTILKTQKFIKIEYFVEKKMKNKNKSKK